jgi:hypothetical protein
MNQQGFVEVLQIATNGKARKKKNEDKINMRTDIERSV